MKVDVVNKQHVEWSEDNVYPSEPIFVASPFAKVCTSERPDAAVPIEKEGGDDRGKLLGSR